jgi:hypothetical protein
LVGSTFASLDISLLSAIPLTINNSSFKCHPKNEIINHSREPSRHLHLLIRDQWHHATAAAVLLINLHMIKSVFSLTNLLTDFDKHRSSHHHHLCEQVNNPTVIEGAA